MDFAGGLRAVSIDGVAMIARGALAIPVTGGNLSVGGGIAYISNSNGQGFATANVSNLDSLTLISGPDANNIAAASIVANGSGLAVGVGNLFNLGSFFNVVNVADPANTAAFITEFSLPQNGSALDLAPKSSPHRPQGSACEQA